jgi:CBS domain-containing protein
MTTRVVTVRPEEAVAAAVERMLRYGFSALPVVDGGYRLIGIVSLLDVLRHREAEPEAGDDVPVDAVMSTDVLTMSPNANRAVVATQLRDHGQLRVMPIVERGRLVGVLTRSDLLRRREPRRPLDGLRRRLGGDDRAEEEVLQTLESPRRVRYAPPGTTPVRDVMTTGVVSVGPGELAVAAAEQLLRHRFTGFPVVEDGDRLVGVVTEADLLRASAHEARVVVGAVMTRTPITIDALAPVAEARSLVADRGVRLLPVVVDGRLVGVLSRGDLL